MNYKETQVSGSQWQRSHNFVGYNVYGETPAITFNEEVRAVVGDKTFGQFVGSVTEKFTDPTERFDLINPNTGDVIGAAIYMDFYIMLHSMYMHLVGKRDYVPPPADPVSVDPVPPV